MAHSLPLGPEQQKRLAKAFTEPPCACPMCRLGREELPQPNEHTVDALTLMLALFAEETPDRRLPYRDVIKWIARAFMIGYSYGYTQATQGDTNDHHHQS